MIRQRGKSAEPLCACQSNLQARTTDPKQKEPAIWRVLSVWGRLCELVSWIDRHKEARRIFRAAESSVGSFFCFLEAKTS